MAANKILYDYIVDEYGDVVKFSNECGINLIDLNAVLLKDNISKEICMGINLCDILNIDIEEMIFDGQIKDIRQRKSSDISKKSDKSNRKIRKSKTNKAEKTGKTAAGLEIYGKCMRLSEIEKKKVLGYIDSISDENI